MAHVAVYTTVIHLCTYWQNVERISWLKINFPEEMELKSNLPMPKSGFDANMRINGSMN